MCAADQFNVFGVVEGLLQVDATLLTLGAAALVAGGQSPAALRRHVCGVMVSHECRAQPLAEVGLITVVPDDNSALIAVQAITGLAAGLGATTLLGVSALFGALQGSD